MDILLLILNDIVSSVVMVFLYFFIYGGLFYLGYKAEKSYFLMTIFLFSFESNVIFSLHLKNITRESQ